MTPRIRLERLTLFLLAFVTVGLAQSEIPTRITIQNRTGELPFSSSVGSSIEHVDLASGTLDVNIPLWSVPGRGSTAQLAMHWNSNHFLLASRTNASGPYYIWTIGANNGWQVNHGAWTHTGILLQCNDGFNHGWVTNYIYKDESGSSHQIPIQSDLNSRCGNPSVDTGIDLTAQGMLGTTGGVITLPEGTQITDASTSGSSYEDSNGNKHQSSYPSTVSGVDTLGKTFYSGVTTSSPTPPYNPIQTVYTVQDSNGATQNITVNWQTLTINTNFQMADGAIEMSNANWYGISSIILPNGKSYQFHYNDCSAQYCYGELSEIDLPEGGKITYTWATDTNNLYTRRYVTSRTEDAGTGSTATWAISLQPHSLWTQDEVSTVTYPSIPVPGSSVTPQSIFTSSYGQLTDVQIYAVLISGMPLREYAIRYDWDGDPTIDSVCGTSDAQASHMSMRPTRIISIAPNGIATKTEYDYETFNYAYYPYHCTDSRSQTAVTFRGTYGNVTAMREYAWGTPVGSKGAYTDVSASLLRTTTKSYLHNANSAYKTGNIVGKVTSTTITDNLLGTTAAQTNYGYDNTAITGTNNSATQHDSNRGSSYTLRGNLTAMSRWLSGSSYLTTTYGYDDLGNIRSVADPKGYTWTYSYADSFHDSACPPSGGSGQAYMSQATNPAGHLFQFKYYSCSGMTYSRQDQNDINAGRAGTMFSYDALGRMLTVNYPDGGQTASVYNDTPPVSVQLTSLINQGASLVQSTVKDGFGRLVQAKITSDPEGTVYTDTVYDGLGRVYSSSTPYRSTSDATYGITYSYYDSLGRVTRMTEADNSPVSTVYDLSKQDALGRQGLCSTSTDEAGKSREVCADGIGRLTGVWEDPVGLSYETDYRYDALNNLTQVNQGSETRSFTYDPLSRLLTASNPESGVICYGVWSGSTCGNGYDPNGNLIQKTDARGATTIWVYDTLNRLIQKTYSDSTPSVALAYDQNTALGKTLTSPVGRLTLQTTATTERAFSYDPMGRVLNHWDCLPSACPYSTSMLYDLGGDLTQLTYPSGRVITNTYSSAGRATQVALTKANGQSLNYLYASGLKYWPNGSIKTSVLGNNSGTALTETYNYNNRLQMTSENIASPVVYAMNHTYGFVAGQNNGNVPKITDQLSAARTQTFGYDSLNRLSSAVETSWGLSFGYDRYGNLLQQTVTLGNPPSFSSAVNGNNQLVGYAYDAVGNMTGDGFHTYQYDAENRLKSLDTTGATYTYDAENTRVSKRVGSDTAEYIVAQGESLSEHHSANWNDWTDRIYLNGRLLAKTDSFEDRILITGSTSGSQYSLFAFPSAGGYAGYVMRSGDKLFLRQLQSTGSHGGMTIGFADGTSTNWIATDQDGQQLNNDSTSGTWHYRRVDLSAFAGKTIGQIYLTQESSTTANPWNIYFTDIAIVSVDGSVRPLYNRQTSVALAHSGTSNGTASVNHLSGVSQVPDETTTFYHGDHLGSSRIMSSANGYPIWQATYLPFGYEYSSQITVNHFKFTGKERDAESGLDYFGARYYGSSMGRWMSPDPKAPNIKHLFNPQKWNKYNYVLNNPLSNIDPDGLEEVTIQLRAYIPQPHQGPYRGDNRGPTTSQNVTSRTTITVRVETDPTKNGGNPIVSNPGGQAGTTHNDWTGASATQTVGLPTATVTRDGNSNVVIGIKQDAPNPLTPQGATPGIKSDLSVTIPGNASSVTTAGTVSGSPAFELNIGTEGGANINVPLQGASNNPVAFGAGLTQTNPILNTTPLPPPPPSCATGGSCPH